MAMPIASFDAAVFTPLGPVMQQVEVWYTLLFLHCLMQRAPPVLRALDTGASMSTAVLHSEYCIEFSRRLILR